MAQMEKLRQQIEYFPHKPGCYLFKSADGVVLYVGKAKDLRKRTSQYFGQDKRPQLPFLIEDASSIDYIVANSELEALFLENTLIKKHSPKYNIKLKDDKNYAFIVIDYSTQIPQIGYARKIEDNQELQTFLNPSANWGAGKKPKAVIRSHSLIRPARHSFSDGGNIRSFGSVSRKAEYFGPYSSTKKIRETLDFVRRIFPYCANTEVSGRPCFYYHLHRCPGVCVGAVSLEEYEQNLRRIKLFLNGKTTEVKKEVKASMEQASRQKRFELAARLRDQLRGLELLDERQIAQFPTKVNYDFVSLAAQNGLYCINLFKVRDGKLTDKENFVYAPRISDPKLRMDESTNSYESEITQTFFETYYADTTDLPDKIFTQHPLCELSLITELLATRKKKKVDITIPHRGKALQLIKLGQLNAEEALRKQLESDATNIDKINEALEKLQKVLNLPTLPRRIECYDMSNTQGTNPVGSMVVFVDGKPAKSEYRKFKIRSKDTPDDFAMMRETLSRRLARVDSEQVTVDSKEPNSNLKPVTSNLTKWPRPDLIVIDGGKGQLSAAIEAQEEVIRLQVTVDSKEPNSNLKPITSNLPAIPMVGLAKRIEEIFLPNNSTPIILSYDDPALQMLQRLRDEAHRFGITFHRQLRSKQATKSALDSIPGIGPATKKLLKQQFGTVAKIKSTSLEELAKIVGQSKAEVIKKNL
jgi:excinuclease ABC subunit C